MTPPRVVIDTNVLYPPILRGLVLDMADAGLFTPLWSARTLGEWRRLVARRGESIETVIAAMQARWPSATIEGDESLLDLPDPADRHVLAAAQAGGAEVILTENLRDFPRWALGPIRAQAPDAFVMTLWLARRAPVEKIVAARFPGLEGRDLRAALRRAGLPRLGKALAG
jgi:predicted nucleic acid-binding protein